jgi:hypothetical protein
MARIWPRSWQLAWQLAAAEQREPPSSQPHPLLQRRAVPLFGQRPGNLCLPGTTKHLGLAEVVPLPPEKGNTKQAVRSPQLFQS